jgi:hypothetical protein
MSETEWDEGSDGNGSGGGNDDEGGEDESA